MAAGHVAVHINIERGNRERMVEGKGAVPLSSPLLDLRNAPRFFLGSFYTLKMSPMGLNIRDYSSPRRDQ